MARSIIPARAPRVITRRLQPARTPQKKRRPKVAPPVVLADIRRRLEIAMAAAACVSAALRAQHADCDLDSALVLQRCVCDAIASQIEAIDALIGGGQP